MIKNFQGHIPRGDNYDRARSFDIPDRYRSRWLVIMRGGGDGDFENRGLPEARSRGFAFGVRGHPRRGKDQGHPRNNRGSSGIFRFPGIPLGRVQGIRDQDSSN